jgi:hypothetical protein
MFWNYQSEKSKDLISFQYTSMIDWVLQPLALKSWSLSPVRWSATVADLPSINPRPGANTAKRVALLPGCPTFYGTSLSYLPVLRRTEGHITLGINVFESNLIHSIHIPKSRIFSYLIHYQICLPAVRVPQEHW